KAVAIGEIGLDYWYKDARKDIGKKERQRELFRRLLELAKKKNKPVSIHSRGAWTDCVNTTIELGVVKAIFHWFSGPLDVLKKLLDHGYYVSATPAVAYSKEHKAVIENTPLDNLVLETDSPVAYAGETSEPSHIVKALSAVAKIKTEREEMVAEITTENARTVFKI
ncbi:MAG: TatD family hydrolase, partial [Candidatus Bathyarchaeia archaeon]